MPNKPSAKKELRKSAKRKARNKEIITGVKKSSKQSLKAISANDPNARELVMQTLKALDKAAQKGVIKENTKNRKKSRLHLKLNKSVK